MSRTERLLDLIQSLRRHRRPVSGARLADELGVSLRTIYRDIATLTSKGAPIAGGVGLGYVLRPGFTLPPLMFTNDEIEAIALGSGMVARAADPALAKAARNALAKVVAVLPAGRGDEASASGLVVGAGKAVATDRVDLTPIRNAIRLEQKIWIDYSDEADKRTERRIWPISLTFCAHVRLLACMVRTPQGLPALPNRSDLRVRRDWREISEATSDFDQRVARNRGPARPALTSLLTETVTPTS